MVMYLAILDGGHCLLTSLSPIDEVYYLMLVCINFNRILSEMT